MSAIRTALPRSVKPNSARIIDVWRMATVAEMDEGMSWYRDAHSLAKRLDPSNPSQAAGVIAALSPMMPWERNMMLAVRAYEDGAASGALFSSVAKADRIMSGESAGDVLGGDKVRNFWGIIADPEHSDAVCIDRHAFDVAIGRVTDDATRRVLGRVGVYGAFAEAYRRAARALSRETGLDVTPAQVQAVTWVVWRRLKGLTD